MGTLRRGMMGRMGLILMAAVAAAKHTFNVSSTLEKTPAEKIVPMPKYHRYFNQIIHGSKRFTGRAKKTNRLHLSKKAKISRRGSANAGL